MRLWLVLAIIFPVLLLNMTFASLFWVIQPGSAETLIWANNEGDHYPCSREWWNVDAFFCGDDKNWSLTSSFEYELETPACNMFLTLFDLTENRSYSLGSYGDPIGTLYHEKDVVNLSYGGSWMRGHYPTYIVHFERKGIRIHMEYTAVTPSQFVAGNISNGILPMGLGYYIYGFIPRCIVTGVIALNNRTFFIHGQGYYEHVWGNWTYSTPFTGQSDVRGVLSAYSNLARWWLHDRVCLVPPSVTLSSDTNMFGYDWIWALFSNNWTLFYGNIMFWIENGPVFGILYLITDTGEYITFSDIQHFYKTKVYVPEFDVYYPSQIVLTAYTEGKTLHLCFSMETTPHMYLDTNVTSSLWQAIALWESPGTVTGHYSDGAEIVMLSGCCEIEPDRQISTLGHADASFTFVAQRDRVGVEVAALSHYLGVQLELDVDVFPLLNVRLSRYLIRGISP
jgi:hypothetical protein